jgi:hypothetical protein
LELLEPADLTFWTGLDTASDPPIQSNNITAWEKDEVAVIEGKSCVLGEVRSVNRDDARDDRQSVSITWENTPTHIDAKGKRSSHFNSQASAKPIQKGDFVCLLQGASSPTIIRLRREVSDIIVIAVPPTDNLREWPASITTPSYDLLLVWDWDESRRESQDGEDCGYFISN